MGLYRGGKRARPWREWAPGVQVEAPVWPPVDGATDPAALGVERVPAPDADWGAEGLPR
ncbi:MAG: hypothetical protein R3E96_12915 [Planctomycetota bacterium]